VDTVIQRQRGRERKEKQNTDGEKKGRKRETDEERVGRRDTETDG
jgi:hypothetical protein